MLLAIYFVLLLMCMWKVIYLALTIVFIIMCFSFSFYSFFLLNYVIITQHAYCFVCNLIFCNILVKKFVIFHLLSIIRHNYY